MTVDEIDARVAERREARRVCEYARADAIRAELAADGIVLEDAADGSTWWRRAAAKRMAATEK